MKLFCDLETASIQTLHSQYIRHHSFAGETLTFFASGSITKPSAACSALSSDLSRTFQTWIFVYKSVQVLPAQIYLKQGYCIHIYFRDNAKTETLMPLLHRNPGCHVRHLEQSRAHLRVCYRYDFTKKEGLYMQ